MISRARTTVSVAAPAAAAEPQLPQASNSATITRLFPQLPKNTALSFLPVRPLTPRFLSFIVVVVMPVAAAAVYYLLIAADQYVAEFRLSLRTVDQPRVEALALFGGDVGHSGAAPESQIVAQYIASRAIVDDLDPKLDLRRLFSVPQADWWARLCGSASIERLVRYWQDQVDPFYDQTTGTIIVRTRAFTPDNTLALAQAIVGASERLINDLSARSRRDAVGYAEAEVAEAESRLKTALAAIGAFRDRAGTIDPAKAADANATLSTKLRDELLKATARLATLKAVVREETPAIRVLKAHIRSLETEQRELAREMTANPAATSTKPALSQQMGAYETLEAERKFAETAYQHALEGLDRARDNADRRHIYIESFVPPSLPQESLYPRRGRLLGTVALIAFAIWAIGCLAVQSIRDHL
jgi:capsular polysaccharide transport system permease protein